MTIRRADATAPGSPFDDARQIVAWLRNTIHDEGLPAVRHTDASAVLRCVEDLVRVPGGVGKRAAARQRADEAMSRRGGPEGFGVRSLDDWTVVEPDRFVDAAVRLALDGIETVLGARGPVGLGSDAVPAAAGAQGPDTRPRTVPFTGMTNGEVADRCRLLLGLRRPTS